MSGLKFVKIPPGEFVMGTPPEETGHYFNEIPHRVRLTKGFEMQVTTVTQKQYFDVMGTNPSGFNKRNYCPETYQAVLTIDESIVTLCPTHPVENVLSDEVDLFLTRLNDRMKDQYHYRLPTEAEWEYAARAGTTSPYYFGADSSQLGLHAWTYKTSLQKTRPVGQLQANGFGLFDMLGNVQQIVQDWYAPYYVSHDVALDPTGPAGPVIDPEDLTITRIARGCSYYDWDETDCRSGRRQRYYSGTRYTSNGFRLVRTRVLPK